MEPNANSNKFIAISSCAWASHFLSLWGGFAFDDSEAIVKNKDILPSTPIENVFRNDFWGTNIALNVSHKSYRPLTVLSYRLNMFFSNSRLDAFQFHTANVVLHGILSIMMVPFFECLLKRRKKRKSLCPWDDPAFTAALMFAAHPIHSEAVAALVGRADILSAILFISVIIFYKIPSSFFGWFVMVLVLTSAAVLCKETAITVLGVCVLYEIYLRKKPSKLWEEVFTQKLLIRLCSLVVIGSIIMFLRLKIMNFEGPTFSPTDNPAAFADSFLTRVLSHSYIYLINVVLLIWPNWMCFDWSMGCIPLIESYTDFRILWVICFWLIVAAVAFKIIKDLFLKEKIDVSVMGVSLIVIPFLPSSNLFLKVGFVVAERTLLLPSAGWCLLVAVGLEKLKNRYENIKIIFTIFYIILISTFITRSIYRNYEWVTEDRLFKSALKVCPLNAKVHYNIAKIAADQGNKEEALRGYKKALEMYPNYEQAMNNLANLLRESGQLEEAEALLRTAVQVRPNFAAAWMNLGIVLSSKGYLEEAEKAYKTALRHRMRYSDAQYNLGNLYLDLGRHQEALAAWKEAVRLRPTHSAAWGNALALLDSDGRTHEAVELGILALQHVPRAPAIHFALGNVLGKLNRFPEAETHFLQAIKLNENNALYYSNLGVLYHRWEKRNKAEQMYLMALNLDPDLKSAQVNLRKLITSNNSAQLKNHSNNHSKKLST
ncbi:protein O-mannosyl-transferase TMTC4-like [Anthonomus grandis grandis]|uniref:protein O-mannosyl-transferase TMTC4-like n=1 Tax=Anthonomus grandis grandis TaxID=2921223 RepID=UPI002164F674|nr:protein O-mannosyl-transferase TMTC4-like [Anthonomus grandis grandis]